MGSRLNVAVVENGRTTLYRSKWGGDEFDGRLFFGPRRALAYARGLSEADPASGWYGEEAQGAALIDCDARRLLWFGGVETAVDVLRRAAWLELMTPQWPGWRIDWAVEGIFEIREAFGEERRPYRVGAEGFSVAPGDGLLGDMLLTWRRADGADGARRMNGAVDSLWLGPKGVEAALDAVAGAPAFRERDDGWFDCGAHVDFAARRLAFWAAAPAAYPEFNAKRAWRGWDVAWLRDDWRAHLALSPLAPPLPDDGSSMREALDAARAHLDGLRQWIARPQELDAVIERLEAKIGAARRG